MSGSSSILAYIDCFDVMDRALDEPIGVRLRCDSESSAIYQRMRFNNARSIDRKANLEIYEKGHKLHGRSVYDQLKITYSFSSGYWWVALTRITMEAFHIESLGGRNDDETDQGNSRKTSGED